MAGGAARQTRAARPLPREREPSLAPLVCPLGGADIVTPADILPAPSPAIAGAPLDFAIIDRDIGGGTGGGDGAGLVLARRLREDTIHRHARIIMCTARGTPAATQSDTVVDAVLRKPMRPSLLGIAFMPRDVTRAAAEPGLPMPPGAAVLLIEDNEMNRYLAERLLARLGCDFDVAADGVQALARAAERRYDLILMDVQMPVMDGLQAAARIRALGGEKSEVPIIAITAHVRAEDVARCKAAGMQAHVGKPINRDALLAAIASCIGKSIAA
jgi:CheY-like chemotaxis protein